MDGAMNESELGAGILYYVDNVAPYVDLNPRWIREIRDVGEAEHCSTPFDVLGEDAEDDLTIVPPHVLVRALAYDRTNAVAGQSPIYSSHTNPSSVRLYLQPDADAPLLTNRRGNDDLCDDITEPNKLPFAELRFIPVEGDLPGAKDFDRSADPPVSAECIAELNSGTPRCGGDSDMVRVIAHESRGSVPVVYAVGTEQADRSDLACTGVTWQIWPNLTNRREGWVCLAAVAEDAVGNRDVSAPLRLCVHDGQAPEPECNPNDAPSCTDGCDPRRANVPWPFAPDGGILRVD
jgi:hypothetical protein